LKKPVENPKGGRKSNLPLAFGGRFKKGQGTGKSTFKNVSLTFTK
jgi:hypothetical protein